MKKKLTDILKDWATLNNTIQSMTEEQCQELLDAEKAGQRRLSFLIRIYGRLNKLRTRRERSELVKGSN